MPKTKKSNKKANEKVRCDLANIQQAVLKPNTLVYWKSPFPKPTAIERKAMEWSDGRDEARNDGRQFRGMIAPNPDEWYEREVLKAQYESFDRFKVDFKEPARLIELKEPSDSDDWEDRWKYYIRLFCKLKNGEYTTINVLNLPKCTQAAERKGDRRVLAQLRKLKPLVEVDVKPHRVLKTYHVWSQKTRKQVDKIFTDMWPKLREIVLDYEEGPTRTHQQNVEHNQFPKDATRKAVLPMIRYMKRSLNVYGMHLIKDCMEDQEYNDDDVWMDPRRATEHETDAYALDEDSYVNDGKAI